MENAHPVPDDADALLDAALILIAERGFAVLTLAEIAAAAKVPLAAIYRTFPTKSALLDALIRRTDLTVLSQEVDGAEAPRDRLFDLLMRRFEALAPYREALRVISHEMRRVPGTALSVLPSLVRSMQWMLDAAGVSDGRAPSLRAVGLAGLYLSVVPVWLGDDDPGRARTMATLDRRLRRAEEMIRRARPARTAPAAGTA